MKTDIYLDGPDFIQIKNNLKNREIKGFTFNPSLFKKINVKNYLATSRKLAKLVYPKPISLEVFADNEEEIFQQALILSKVAKNVEVKIPIAYTNGKSTKGVIKRLVNENINLNLTAIFSYSQVREILGEIKDTKTILSIFAGRIHDMGIDASKEILKISKLLKKKRSKCRLLWASTRQIYDLILAENCGCKIITISPSIYEKKINFKRNWREYSLSTVRDFYKDAKDCNFTI